MNQKKGAEYSIIESFFNHFMGHSPRWYKFLIIIFLLLNPFLLLFFGPFTTGWIILIEFILTLALALKCYPLLPGGLLAIETVFMGMVSPQTIFTEVSHNLEVIMLLMFMVAGIYFMKDLLSWIFTKLLLSTKSKIALSLMFSFAGAFLSAWLDALTVIAVMIAVTLSFYNIYNETSYQERVPLIFLDKNPLNKFFGLPAEENIETISENETEEETFKRQIIEKRRELGREDLSNFNGFLRNLLMHGAVGTALGGVSTIVGEPQNLLIGNLMGWSFKDFFLNIAHISIPVMIAGLLTVIMVEKFKIFGYGYKLPERVRNILKKDAEKTTAAMTKDDYFKLTVQGIAAIWLITGLALHLAAVGLIGLSVIIFLTIFTGKSEEHQIGKAFEEALPFTALLVVFFAIVGMIQTSNLFQPIISAALARNGEAQIYSFFFASAILSAISDNVFVATIYIQEALKAYNANLIDGNQLNALAVAINVGTNIPSVATPNGQAAFLFLLTSAIASRIRLSYLTMIKMAFPYTIVLTLVALAFINLDWVPNKISEPPKTEIESNSH